MDKYVCLWNNKGLTYKEWMKEQEEEEKRAKELEEWLKEQEEEH